MKRFALPSAALALLAGIALVSTAVTPPTEQAPAPAAEHSLVSGGAAVDGELPTLPLDD